MGLQACKGTSNIRRCCKSYVEIVSPISGVIFSGVHSPGPTLGTVKTTAPIHATCTVPYRKTLGKFQGMKTDR